MNWVKVTEITGGLFVRCVLCGTRETFRAAHTNYAEARRLATAESWHHEHSEMHRAAVSAYHAPPPASPEELALAARFGKEAQAATSRRAARNAARKAAGKPPVTRGTSLLATYAAKVSNNTTSLLVEFEPGDVT